MSNREQMLSEFILEAMANDYESFACILDQVTKWAGEKQLHVTRDDIAVNLGNLIRSGYAKAYILSASPPHSQVAEFSHEHIDDLWYHPTPAGKKLVEAL